MGPTANVDLWGCPGARPSDWMPGQWAPIAPLLNAQQEIVSEGFVCRRTAPRTHTVSQSQSSSHPHSRPHRQAHLHTILHTLASASTTSSGNSSSTQTPLAPTIDQLTTNSFALTRASNSPVDLFDLATCESTLHCKTEAKTSIHTSRVLNTQSGAGVRLRARDGRRSLVLRH